MNSRAAHLSRDADDLECFYQCKHNHKRQRPTDLYPRHNYSFLNVDDSENERDHSHKEEDGITVAMAIEYALATLQRLNEAQDDFQILEIHDIDNDEGHSCAGGNRTGKHDCRVIDQIHSLSKVNSIASTYPIQWKNAIVNILLNPNCSESRPASVSLYGVVDDLLSERSLSHICDMIRSAHRQCTSDHTQSNRFRFILKTLRPWLLYSRFLASTIGGGSSDTPCCDIANRAAASPAGRLLVRRLRELVMLALYVMTECSSFVLQSPPVVEEEDSQVEALAAWHLFHCVTGTISHISLNCLVASCASYQVSPNYTTTTAPCIVNVNEQREAQTAVLSALQLINAVSRVMLQSASSSSLMSTDRSIQCCDQRSTRHCCYVRVLVLTYTGMLRGLCHLLRQQANSDHNDAHVMGQYSVSSQSLHRIFRSHSPAEKMITTQFLTSVSQCGVAMHQIRCLCSSTTALTAVSSCVVQKAESGVHIALYDAIADLMSLTTPPDTGGRASQFAISPCIDELRQLANMSQHERLLHIAASVDHS